MGVFRKYRDAHGNLTGPWFIQYPVERDIPTGKIKYRTKKASWKKKKAEKILREKQADFYERERLGLTVDPDLSFKKLVDWALDQEVMKAKVSASDDLTRAKNLKAYFGRWKASLITPLMVENFRIKMKQTVSEQTGKPYSGATVNKMVSLGRRIYYLGMDGGMVNTNPFARRGLFKEEPKGQYVSDEEFRKIFGVLRDYLKPVALTAYLTGMRRGEILNLSWDRVDLFKGILDLTAADTKTNEARYIFLNTIPELKKVFIEAARGRKSGQELVFVKPDGNPVPKWYMERLFKRACEKAELGPYRFHDLRHTFNTNMLKAGVDEAVIMKLTGHKTRTMFFRYSHLDRELGEAAMGRLSRLLSKRVKGRDKAVEVPKREEQEK
jgi:integrase